MRRILTAARRGRPRALARQARCARRHALRALKSPGGVCRAYSPAATMATTAHLERLNAAQRKAVLHGEPLPEKGYQSGPLLIVAGAGTGKTDTLAHRVAHLVI